MLWRARGRHGRPDRERCARSATIVLMKKRGEDRVPRQVLLSTSSTLHPLHLPRTRMGSDDMSAAGPSLSAGQSALRQAKRSLRKQMGAQLDALSASSIAQQSSQITSHALNQPAFHQADKISIYVSMEKGEVKTEDLCRETLALGKRLYVPKFATLAAASGSNAKFESDMRMLRIYNWKDYEAMVINKWGIREPADVIDERNREDGEKSFCLAPAKL
jgi:5-formyltetrahydrofolate cyclo-ligase